MKKILVAVDFTPASRKAAEYAALVAQASGGGLHLLHVHMEPLPMARGPLPWASVQSEVHVENEARINKEIELLQDRYQLAVTGSVAGGFKSDTICETAKEIDADLVVLGLKKDKKHIIPGSTALKVIRKTHLPVLLVAEESRIRTPKNMALAVDFNELVTRHCLDTLSALVHQFEASLRVLHVERKGADLKAEEVPGKLQLGVALAKLSYVYDKLEADNMEKAIINFVQEHPVDLLAMIAHQHSIFERWFGTVHTDAISREINIPLLVLKNE